MDEYYFNRGDTLLHAWWNIQSMYMKHKLGARNFPCAFYLHFRKSIIIIPLWIQVEQIFIQIKLWNHCCTEKGKFQREKLVLDHLFLALLYSMHGLKKYGLRYAIIIISAVESAIWNMHYSYTSWHLFFISESNENWYAFWISFRVIYTACSSVSIVCIQISTFQHLHVFQMSFAHTSRLLVSSYAVYLLSVIYYHITYF